MEITFGSQADFEAWLEENWPLQEGIWLKIAKAGTGITSITHPQALEAALCFGWIDGQRKGLDQTWFLQKFTPRRPRSKWSEINRKKCEELIAAGRMRPSGQSEVDRAIADGRWEETYHSAKIPPELQEVLDSEPDTAAFFNSLDATNRFAYVFRITTAKRAETKQKHLAKLRDREKFY